MVRQLFVSLYKRVHRKMMKGGSGGEGGESTWFTLDISNLDSRDKLKL